MVYGLLELRQCNPLIGTVRLGDIAKVELGGENYAIKTNAILKRLRSANSILADHRIDNEEDLIWRNCITD